MRLIRLATSLIQDFSKQSDTVNLDGRGGLIPSLVQKNILDPSCLNKSNPTARQLAFGLMGWTLMLYTPNPSYNEPSSLQIHDEGSSCFDTLSQPAEVSNRSFLELVCGFGKVFPWKEIQDVPSNALSDQLHPANLNVATLFKSYGVTVKWVSCFTSHLEFHEVTRKLSIFCLPSFCKLHDGNETAMERYNFHSVPYKPPKFSVAQVMQEILLSYQLFFLNSSQACQYYRRKQRQVLKTVIPEGNQIDPTLDWLCGYHQTKSSESSLPERTVFSKEVDFPVFAERLSKLQKFASKQQSGTLKAVWSDHRNFEALYTFRAVIIFGTVSVILSFIQVVLQAIQTTYTMKSYSNRGNEGGIG
ncbi:hypothetical protein K469DRAFT_656205 [Zopfia rhizophila CBS 207.26]|uniref:Uncharacterized protein n=1 Tax=Zopfia rhizophila CBS 207.26 TaxID=1314779 RepID=A0A6A6EI63_9PEZI|nr:hypothetical protein K469DRAFT_656205 [Zopfia rhizophila CBS 207.26]